MKTSKQKFQLLIETLEKGGWDFMGLRKDDKHKEMSWEINDATRGQEGMDLIVDGYGKDLYVYTFDLATVLGNLSARKIIFGKEWLCQSCGKNKTKRYSCSFCGCYTYVSAHEFHSVNMILTGEPLQWLDYAVKFIKGKDETN